MQLELWEHVGLNL